MGRINYGKYIFDPKVNSLSFATPFSNFLKHICHLYLTFPGLLPMNHMKEGSCTALFCLLYIIIVLGNIASSPYLICIG